MSKDELKASLAKKYNVADDKCIILFGFQIAFGKGLTSDDYRIGGGRSTGFALIYDSINDVKKFEAKYRLARVYSHLKGHWVVWNPGVSSSGKKDAQGKEESPEEDLGNGSSCCSP